MKFSRFFRKGLIALALAGMATTFGGPSANAATVQTTLTVQAQVAASCIISTTSINFGPYDPMGTEATTPLDGQGEVSVECANGLAVIVHLSEGGMPGTGSTPASPVRQMTEVGGDLLAYNLYTDAGRADVWGDVTAGVGATGLGAGNPVALPVYGRIPAGQNPQAGAYLDTVTATVEF